MLAITLADHSFYPLSDDRGEFHKNLVLTTAHDGQNRALIRFCRVSRDTTEQEQVAVLDFQDLPSQTHGELEIDLELDTDDTGNLAVAATERSSGRTEKILIPWASRFSFPGEPGDLDNPETTESGADEYHEPPWNGMESSSEEDPFILDTYGDDYTADPNKIAGKNGGKKPLLLILIILLFLVLLGLGLWYFLGRSNSESQIPVPPVQTPTEQPQNQTQAPPAVQQESPRVAEPVSEPVPQVTTPQPADPQPVGEESNVNHRIIWGDTLWHLSQRFYGTPWRYPDIADYNLIPNPDLIIAGEEILIPVEKPE